MRCSNAAYVGLLMAIAVLLAGCGSGGGGQEVTWLVNVTGRLSDATTHGAVAGGTVTIGGEPAVNSGADGWFTVPDVGPGTNLTFQAVHDPDYEGVLGVLTLDATARTWSLLVVGGAEKQGTLIEGSPGHLSSPAEGQAGAMVVDMTAVGDGDGDDVPPPPPF